MLDVLKISTDAVLEILPYFIFLYLYALQMQQELFVYSIQLLSETKRVKLDWASILVPFRHFSLLTPLSTLGLDVAHCCCKIVVTFLRVIQYFCPKTLVEKLNQTKPTQTPLQPQRQFRLLVHLHVHLHEIQMLSGLLDLVIISLFFCCE